MPKASKGFYAVQAGHQPGVYHDWKDAESQVKGFKGAKHKKFKTIEEANAYISAPSSSNSSGRGTQPYSRPSSSNGSSTSKKTKKTHNNTSVPLKQIWTPQFQERLIQEGCLVAFADGSCRGNGKAKAIAGSGVFWVHPASAENVSERLPGKQTNQCAELFALLRALETDPDPTKRLFIFSDSTYSIKCMTEWVPGWMQRNWRTSEGKEPENVELIKLVHLKAQMRPAKVEFSWVKAHCGTHGNEMADLYAVQGSGRIVIPRNWDDDLSELLAQNRKAKTASSSSVSSQRTGQASLAAIKKDFKPLSAQYSAFNKQKQQSPEDDLHEDWLLTAEEEAAELEAAMS